MKHSTFPEANHPLIQRLLLYEDSELLSLWQQHPDQGKYLVAIFCRHSPLIYTLITNFMSSEDGVNHLFVYIWEKIFVQLSSLKLDQKENSELQSLSTWLIYICSLNLVESEFLSLEFAKETISGRYLPLKFYLEQALDSLPPLHRLILVMSEKFAWTYEQIIDYLEQQGESFSMEDLQVYLSEAYQLLKNNLPEDICTIYSC